MKYDFATLIKSFGIEGKLIECEPYGEGHINSTFLARVEGAKGIEKYIVQKINTNLFKNVDGLMNNIMLVCDYNAKVIKERGGDPIRESLTLIKTPDNKPYIRFADGCFRIYIYIEGTVAYQKIEKKEHFFECASAFGNFANLLGSFDASKIYEVLPDFHNTEKRFRDFTNSLNSDVKNRAVDVKEEIDFVLKREQYCGKIVSLLRSGKIPTRVTHNDTKLNNVLFDAKTGKARAVIDLDTIMPGSLCYDFGDAIRFGCNTGYEDEPDLSKMDFSIELFEEFTRGYLGAVGSSITETERKNLVWGAILMTYECGMRFLADYLDGDIYFKTKCAEHNVYRARTQFKLVRRMEENFDALEKIIEKY